MSTLAAAQSAAARRHSVTPPHSEASTLTRSTAPASRRRRTPWLVISLCPAVAGRPRSGVQETARAVAGDLAPPGRDGDPCVLADAGHESGIVVPVARLLE